MKNTSVALGSAGQWVLISCIMSPSCLGYSCVFVFFLIFFKTTEKIIQHSVFMKSCNLRASFRLSNSTAILSSIIISLVLALTFLGAPAKMDLHCFITSTESFQWDTVSSHLYRMVCLSVCPSTIMPNRPKPLKMVKDKVVADWSTTDTSICLPGLVHINIFNDKAKLIWLF